MTASEVNFFLVRPELKLSFLNEKTFTFSFRKCASLCEVPQNGELLLNIAFQVRNEFLCKGQSSPLQELRFTFNVGLILTTQGEICSN